MPKEMTLKSFKELLAGYLTDPDYAKVSRLADGRLSVKLPDGGGKFIIQVTKPAR